MGCMEEYLSSCLGWDSRKMTVELMEWSGTALMSYGGGCGGGKMWNEADLWRKLKHRQRT
jgi:hypothetical protein